MTYLLLRLLKDDLKEYTYAARLAGLVYGIASGMNAILVSKLEVGWINERAHFEALAECGNGLVYCECLLVAALSTNTNVICDCTVHHMFFVLALILRSLEFNRQYICAGYVSNHTIL